MKHKELGSPFVAKTIEFLRRWDVMPISVGTVDLWRTNTSMYSKRFVGGGGGGGFVNSFRKSVVIADGS